VRVPQRYKRRNRTEIVRAALTASPVVDLDELRQHDPVTQLVAFALAEVAADTPS
jgi:hypothetical protein